MLSFLKAKVNLLALMYCGLSVGFWMLGVARGYYYFVNDEGRDIGFNAQTLWCILHGSLSPSIFNASFIADHCYFLSFLVAPLYWLWPDAMLLQYLKIWSFFAGAYIFFLILKKYLHPFIALVAMIAFCVAPANCSMLYGGFNYEPFAIPLIFLIFKALDENNLKLYLISCFFLAMVKEQMPLVVMMFGVLSFFFKRKDKLKWALLPFAAGLAFFIFEVFILTPFIRKGFPVSVDHYWGARYMQWGRTPQEILFFLSTHPLTVLRQFVLPWNIRWYNDLVGVWGALSFLSPHILLVALPLFLKAILSSNLQEHDVLWPGYYASIFTPFIFLAAWNTLNHIQNRWRLSIHALALAIMLIHALFFIPFRLALLDCTITNDALAEQRFIDKIPPGAPVLSALKTYPLLANRKEIYPVCIYLDGRYLVTEGKFELPGNTDYLLLDFANEWSIIRDPYKYVPGITALNFDNRWRLQESIEDVALFVKNPSRQKADRLIERSFQPFAVKNTSAHIFDQNISLEGIGFPRVFSPQYRIFPVTMYWKCLHQTNIIYDMLINITSSNGKSYYSKWRPIGSTIYPTYFWKKGEYVKESYFYLLPHMPQGNFDISIYVYNPAGKKWVGEARYNFTV